MYDDIKYAELLRKNNTLARSSTPSHSIAVISNITISPIKEVLEYSLRSRGINAVVEVGDYDNIVQNSIKYSKHDAICIFYELANISDKLPYSLHVIDSRKLEVLTSKAMEELAHIFATLATSKLVIFNLLTAIPFSMDSPQPTPLDRMCEEINKFALSSAPKSFKFIDTSKLLARCSVRSAIDLRFFLSSRALYTYSFLRAYSEFIYPIVATTTGHIKKILVLDCDNTLWKGIIGEDGLDGIQVFAEIQSLAVKLAENGTLICLCSKNNPEDVDLVLNQHSQMVLSDDHIVLKAVNWNEKADNIKWIAQTLNVALDSVVFFDDNDFELELVRAKLPTVTVYKVPSDYSEYLRLFQTVTSLFHKENITNEDRAKVSQYKTEFARNEHREQIGNLEKYLSSLELSIRLKVDDPIMAPRLAQLTQKTNQFNLTTQRMSETEVYSAIVSTQHVVVGIDVSDKFGSYGTSGLVLAKLEGETAYIDNFLLSCRVLGRGVELTVFDVVVDLLRSRGVTIVCGTFLPSNKNEQVRDLYSRLGFALTVNEPNFVRFQLDIDRYQILGATYIEVNYA